MTDLLMLTPEQMRRIEPYFPLSHGVPRVDDRRVLSGILFVIRNGLRWRDAPAGYGPHKTIYNRFIRWSRLGVFNRILAELAAQSGGTEKLMIDATHLKAHRTAASLLKKGSTPMYRTQPGRVDYQTAGGLRRQGTAAAAASERGTGQRSQDCCRSSRAATARQLPARRQGLQFRCLPAGAGRSRHHAVHSSSCQTPHKARI